MNKENLPKNKVAVLTGGSSGIGAILAKELKKNGYTVVCVSRSHPEEECDFFACDLSLPDVAELTARAVREKYPHIHLVINNAGLGISGATEFLPEESIRYVWEVDYFAPLLFTRALLPALQKGDKIVMIGSACALFALPYRNVYCSAKAALSMLSYGLRMELAPLGIAVVNICPGDIKSAFTANRLKFTDADARYGERVLSAQQKVDGREHKRMNAEKAGKKIARLCMRKKGALYIVGAKYKALHFFSRFVSQNFLLKATNKLFGK